jgi:hypothetical protein
LHVDEESHPGLLTLLERLMPFSSALLPHGPSSL